MTENVVYKNMEPFENPDLLPLENLKLKMKTNGVVENIDALSKRWITERYYLHYEAPHIYDDNGCEITGAKARWIEIISYMIDDLKWLLSLPFYRFWSNIIYNTSILDTLVSFLQEAPPFYALENFPNCPEMLALLEKLSRFVLLVFTRLITNKESAKEYMSCEYLGNLLYENYIFTVPIIFDLCQLYGRENEKIVGKILSCLFTLEPRYTNDLQKTVPCLIEALGNVERRFVSDSALPGACIENTKPMVLTLFNLEDMILYILDIISTINVSLKNYHAAVSIFRKEDFINKIVSIYEKTIPQIYKTLDKLAYNDENMPKYMELKHRLDVTRIEILNLFRVIIYEPVQHIQENLSTMEEAKITEQVHEYINALSRTMSEEQFFIDYNRLYAVETDLKLLLNTCPGIDTVKCDYILQSIAAIIGKPSAKSISLSDTANEPVAGPSGISQQTIIPTNTNSSNEKRTSIRKNSVELVSLISEVKDILCDLDERFIEICLEYYDYDFEAVINAILEDALPPTMKELKDFGPLQVPSPPPTYQEAVDYEELAHGTDTLNMINNFDDCHIKTREVIEISKDYITKNYSLVADVYDDEYDDTYDNHDVTELNSRPFTTPRVLCDTRKVETADEFESQDEDEDPEQNGVDHFVQNPEEARAKAEQRRQVRLNAKGVSSTVAGKLRRKGSENNESSDRYEKNVRKATYANHNRRAAARWKQKQGMIPS